METRLTTGQTAWGFLVASSREAPSSYPAPVRFSAPVRDSVWWAWRQPNAGIQSAYLCWANGRTVLINCRSMLERDDRLSNAASYDGRAAGPMGPAMNAVIDDAMLRRLWTWLDRARREGRLVVSQATLDVVATAARTRTTSDGLVAAMILCAWHTGGLTGGSAPSLTNPSEFFLIMQPGWMPRYGEPLLMVDQATAYAAMAMINNLDNVPRSGYAQLDAWRTDVAPAAPPSTSSPSTPSSPAAPSSSTGGSKGGTTWTTGPVYQPSSSNGGSSSLGYSQPLPVYDGFGGAAPQPSSPLPSTASAPSPSQSPLLPSAPSTAPSSPAPGSPPNSAVAGLGALNASVASVGQKAMPYVAAGGLILVSAGIVYWTVRKTQEARGQREED